MSERPAPERSGAILRLCAETIRAAWDDDAPVLGMGAEEARVLALAASADMERLREQVIEARAESDRRVAQVIEARAEADRRVAEERATLLKFLRGVPVWRAVQELADAIERGDHLRDRGTP